MLCPKYEKRSVPISPEDARKVEGLYFEKGWRANIINYIKRNGIQVPQELMEAYRKEYVDFVIRLRQAIMGCVIKYAKRCPKKVHNARVNYKSHTLYWDEEVQL